MPSVDLPKTGFADRMPAGWDRGTRSWGGMSRLFHPKTGLDDPKAWEEETLAWGLQTREAFSKPQSSNSEPIPTMPTGIETSRAFVKERTGKTRAAQSTLATDSGWT